MGARDTAKALPAPRVAATAARRAGPSGKQRRLGGRRGPRVFRPSCASPQPIGRSRRFGPAFCSTCWPGFAMGCSVAPCRCRHVQDTQIFQRPDREMRHTPTACALRYRVPHHLLGLPVHKPMAPRSLMVGFLGPPGMDRFSKNLIQRRETLPSRYIR